MLKKILDLIRPVQPEEFPTLSLTADDFSKSQKKKKRKLIRKPKNKMEKVQWSCLSLISLVFLIYIFTLVFLEIFFTF